MALSNLSAINETLNITNCTPPVLDKGNLNRFYPFIILCSIAVIGNILNLVVFSSKNMSAVIFIFIRANVLSDIFIILCHIIITIDRDWTEEVIYKTYSGTFLLVYLFEYLNEVFLAISNHLTLIISTERYFAICQPLRAKWFRNHSTAIIMCIVVYVLAFLFHIPKFFSNYIDFCAVIERCRFDLIWCYFRNETYRGQVGYIFFRHLREVSMRLLPTFIIVVLNIITIVTYNSVVKKRAELVNQTVKAEKSLMMFLFIVLFDFFMSAIPGIVLHFIDMFKGWDTTLFDITRGLEVIGFGLTIFLNIICNKTFRNTLLSIFNLPHVGKISDPAYKMSFTSSTKSSIISRSV